MQLNEIIDPAERLWILDNIRAELESNHLGTPDAEEMTFGELISRPDKAFTLKPVRLRMLRRLYMKLKIGEEA